MFEKFLSILMRRLSKSHVVIVGVPGMATHSFVRVDGEGRHHQHLIGRTAYGKGNLPEGGHKTDIVTEVVDHSSVPMGRKS